MGRVIRFQWNQEGDEGILSKLVLQKTGKSKETDTFLGITDQQAIR